MSRVLDAILVKEMCSYPTTVNTNFTSDVVEIDNREDAFTVQLNYNNGSSVDMDLNLEYSSDGINFVVAKTQNITDDTGTHLWDIEDTGSRYLRVTITVNSGSIDVTRMLYSGRRRH